MRVKRTLRDAISDAMDILASLVDIRIFLLLPSLMWTFSLFACLMLAVFVAACLRQPLSTMLGRHVFARRYASARRMPKGRLTPEV